MRLPKIKPPVLQVFMSQSEEVEAASGMCFQVFVTVSSDIILPNPSFEPPKRFSKKMYNLHICTMFVRERDATIDKDNLVSSAKLLIAYVRATYRGDEAILHRGVFMEEVMAKEAFGRRREHIQRARTPWDAKYELILLEALKDCGYRLLA